jgi:hypothetical protein
MASRYFNIGTTTDYAKVHGISLRTARRRLAADPNAVKSGRGWRIALPSTTFAKVRGISTKKARREGTRTDNPSEVVKGKTAPSQRGLVPWTQIPARLMRNPRSHPYQYQGAATVVFLASGDTRTVYTENLDSSQPLTYKRLDEEIRKWIQRRFGKSPIEIIRTWPHRAVSHLPFTPLRLVS